MEPNVKLAAFYSYDEVLIKDLEKDLYARDRKTFHLFFFNNSGLHFSKKKIYEENLIEDFRNIAPEIKYDKKKKTVTMTKKIIDFNAREFNGGVNEKYRQYINSINYRIECIFQTFNLFCELYRDKMIVFIFPYQLYKKFIVLSESKKLNFEFLALRNSEQYLNYFDLVYWINYFMNISGGKNKSDFRFENIKKILKIN